MWLDEMRTTGYHAPRRSRWAPGRPTRAQPLAWRRVGVIGRKGMLTATSIIRSSDGSRDRGHTYRRRQSVTHDTRAPRDLVGALAVQPPSIAELHPNRATRDQGPQPHSENPHTWHLAQPSMNASCEPQSGHAPMKSCTASARSPAVPSGPGMLAWM